jgi:hypothetical protein
VVRACEAGGRGPGVSHHAGREIVGSRYSAYPVGYVTTAKSQVVRGPESGKSQTIQPAVARQSSGQKSNEVMVDQGGEDKERLGKARMPLPGGALPA